MGEGGGEGLETGGLAPNLLCSVSGFKGEGEHSSEWDLKPVSESLSKVPFKPALSIVSLTARGRPPLTPLHGTARGPVPPHRQEHQAQEDLQALGDFAVHGFPSREGRIPMGAMQPYDQLLSLLHPSCSPRSVEALLLSWPAAEAHLLSLLQTSGTGSVSESSTDLMTGTLA